MSKQQQKRERVLSGIQPSGFLHLGNYFGAVQQHLALQHEFPGEAYYFIANYHALTTTQDAALLQQRTMDLALDYLALGLDPEKATLFRQSDLPAVCELSWFLSTVTPVSLLEKGVSYKDKVGRGFSASAGLLSYPLLMAADILAYRATLVPVGEDQIQHIEFARDMAGFFNNTFGKGQELLHLPTPRFSPGKKVPGTDGQKMSKSYGNDIGIFEEGKALRKKVMGIKTATVELGDPLDPESDTVFALYRLLATEAQTKDLRERYLAGAIGFGQAKKELLALLDEHFAEARERRRDLASRPDDVRDILADGAARAGQVLEETMEICRSAVGVS